MKFKRIEPNNVTGTGKLEKMLDWDNRLHVYKQVRQKSDALIMMGAP